MKSNLLLWSSVMLVLCNSVHAEERHGFTVYQFVPWKSVQAERQDKQAALTTNDYMATFGIKPIKVIYAKFYSTDGKPDHEKIRVIAEATRDHSDIPVSFDTEFGNRFKPETVIPDVLDILATYRKNSASAPVGVYATAPQNTYGWNDKTAGYDKLNAQYQAVAKAVDFLSPVLYNYNLRDRELWKKAAEFNLKAALAYHTGKAVLPYISPVVSADNMKDPSNGSTVETLSEEEMTFRLRTLYELGASGCIIWASSGDRTEEGKQPVFDPKSGWGKAVVEFVASHRDGK